MLKKATICLSVFALVGLYFSQKDSRNLDIINTSIEPQAKSAIKEGIVLNKLAEDKSSKEYNRINERNNLSFILEEIVNEPEKVEELSKETIVNALKSKSAESRIIGLNLLSFKGIDSFSESYSTLKDLDGQVAGQTLRLINSIAEADEHKELFQKLLGHYLNKDRMTQYDVLKELNYIDLADSNVDLLLKKHCSLGAAKIESVKLLKFQYDLIVSKFRPEYSCQNS